MNSPDLAFRTSRRASTLLGLLLVGVVALFGCSSSTDSGENSASDNSGSSGGDRFPDVTKVEISAEDDGTYTFDVTMTSPYDTPERYADGWRIMGADGKVLGQMELGHDHASEQPFTRTQSGVDIPDGVESVEVEGHDTDNGYGGDTATMDIPRS